jgi:ABC-type uncharacterized transport system permease subunit
MRTDALRVSATYAIALLVLIGGFYALVLYPFELDELVKGAIIGFMSLALSFVFNQEVAKTTATATTKALMTSAPANGAAVEEVE